jgi:sugar phosphate isomerase/epimerase
MSKAKVGVSMLYCLGEPFNRMMKRLGKLQTRYVEILDDGTHELDKQRVAALKESAKSYNLEYSLHAPFADINIASPSKAMLSASMKRLRESMLYANAIGAKMWVFHPGARTGIGQFYPGAEWKQNNQSIEHLCDESEKLGLNIAVENLPAKYYFFMSKAEDFQRFYHETNLPVGITLDLGHANLEGQIEPFFNLLADKITHIHASDNTGNDDDHLGIGKGKIDFNWLAETLNKIGYDKSVVVESITDVPESIRKLKQLLI